ncbi:MAG: thiamine diphosphokinase [Erysipelotrichaceae bacterium]
MAKVLPALEADYIGVDGGVALLQRQKRHMIAAIGDFDSYGEELGTIQADTLIRLNKEKDESDTQVALQYAATLGYERIIVYGAFGGRVDHELANLSLLAHSEVPFVLMNETNWVEVVTPSLQTYPKHYTYFSILPIEPSCLSLSGVKYPLDHQTITPGEIYTISNEIQEVAQLQLHFGKVYVLLSNDSDH